MKPLLSIETQKVALEFHAPAGTHPARGDSAKLPIGTCRILPRRTGLTLQPGTHRAGVPEATASDLEQAAGPPLFEETNYGLLLSSCDGRPVELRHRDPIILRDVRPADSNRLWHGSLNFRSQVGISRFSVLSDGRPEFDIEIEIFPSKIDYRSDYAAMLGEVQDLAAGLALEYLRSTHQFGAHMTSRETSVLEWITLLRHLIDDLDKAIAYVSYHPLRALQRRSAMIRIEALRRSDAALRRAVRAGKGRGQRVTLSSGVPARRFLPERRPEPTLDTPEHRWLAAELRRIRIGLAQLARGERRRQAMLGSRGRSVYSERDTKAVKEIEALEARIVRLENSEPLAAAQGLPPSGFASLQLQGAPGYREAFRALNMLRYGLRVQGGPVELSVKDVHVLYEYWCFLALVRLVASVLETPIPTQHLLEARPEGLRLRLQQGRSQSVPFQLPGGRTLSVTYNPLFKDADVLLPQQPDLVLTLSDPNWPTVRLVLDAKYRVQDDPDFIARFGVAGPPPDAVNVLHRYRDAILEVDDAALPDARRRRNVVEGAALYPLNADRAAGFSESRYSHSLDRLGIGALPFLPGSTEWVERWLRSVLKRSGWAVADAVVSHAAQQQQDYWKRASETAVLVGVLRGSDANAHMAWVENERMYYTKFTPTQPRQLQVQRIALYEPTEFRLGRPGQVRRWFTVEGIDVVRRDQIDTPWPASDRGNDLNVVYTLGEMRQLGKPITNSGIGIRQNRWTSALGLERAEEVAELLLESVEEWSVLDALRALGLEVGLQAAHAPRNETGRGSRVWFVTQGGRIRIVGPGLVEVNKQGLIASGKLTALESLLQRNRTVPTRCGTGPRQEGRT